MMTRMRLLEGVTGVSLAASEKGGAGGGSGDDCTNGHDSYPMFSLTVSFEAPTADATAQSSGSSTTQPASSGGTP